MKFAWLAVAALSLGGCSDSLVDREVGARCDNNSECDSRCLPPESDYPGGFCTKSCVGDGECPTDTRCADKNDGVCLFSCEVDRNCEFLGAGWQCQDVDAKGSSGKIKVCRGD